MERVNRDIMQLYIIALKLGMNLNDAPVAWYGVEQANRKLDPDYIIKVPEYIKIIMRYGTKWTQ